MISCFLLCLFLALNKINGSMNCILGLSSTNFSDVSRLAVCDASFYSLLDASNIRCNGEALDVMKASQAAKCLVYKGNIKINQASQRDIPACFSSCSLPGCSNQQGWNYAAEDGLSSSIYDNFDISKIFLSLVNTSFSNFRYTSNCIPNAQESTPFASCNCPTRSIQQSINKTSNSNFDSTLTNVLAPILSTVTGGAVAGCLALAIKMSTNIAVGVMSETSINIYKGSLLIFEQAQFTCMLGQIQLQGANSVFRNVTSSFSWATFTFKTSPPTSLESSNSTSKLPIISSISSTSENTFITGMEAYAKRLGINPSHLLRATLIAFAVLIIFTLIIYGLSLFVLQFLPWDFNLCAKNWFDYVIGFLVLLLVLMQYPISATSVYQLYETIRTNNWTIDSFLAIFSIIFFVLGSLLLACYVMRKYDQEIMDVATVTHQEISCAKRYGAFYTEYTYKKRYFFAPKMIFVIATGIVTGLDTALSPFVQMSSILAIYFIYLSILEIQQPYQTKFLQLGTFLVTILKFSTLILSFMLIEASFFSKNLQNTISYVIVIIQMGVLTVLIIRQVMWIIFNLQKKRKEKKIVDEEQMRMDNVHLEDYEGEAYYPQKSSSNIILSPEYKF